MKKIYFVRKNIKKDNLEIYKNIYDFCKSNCDFDKARAYSIGYENFGIMLVGFCNWIHENKEKNKIDTVVFMARDGYIVKKAYEILFPKDKTEYMYVSRRSLSLPSIALSKSIDEILACMVLPPLFNIRTFLESINFSIDYVENELIEANINENELFKRSELRNNEKIATFVRLIESKIKEKANIQYKYFMMYLEQLKFRGNIALVDIGWHNSIQNNFFKIMGNNKNIRVLGYYLGIYQNAKKIENPHQAEGYLFNYNRDKYRQIQIFSFVSLLETMFLAQEGTTLRYNLIDSEIMPEIAKYEYENNKEMKKIVLDLQNGAIDFVNDFNNNIIMYLNSITPDIASAGIIRIRL